MTKYKVTYGGWYQRTTLHMSEVYSFFELGSSKLALSKDELKKLHKNLDLSSSSRESGYFEYVKATTNDGIEIRYYEDGLYILEISSDDVSEAQNKLESYYEKNFNPAISYIFSLGAPTPKVLANIKANHPVVVSVLSDTDDFHFDESVFGPIYTKVSSGNITVYKTPQYILIHAPESTSLFIPEITEMQIFFREFKDQLEKYLMIHRTIWEEISAIKEAKAVKGREVEEIRGKLDGYQKTISLISNRINQMGSYVSTRSSIAKRLEVDKHLVDIFEYKFETLTDTLSYIKEIWKMTSDYLSSAIGNLVEIKNQSTSNNLKSLQTITSIGVISGVLGYLSAKSVPSITRAGAVYFIALFILTWFMNYAISSKYKNKKYSLKFGNRKTDI
ncbi:MAG: hypothetical protein AAB895_00520 [Patescibacteria group bacterium]